MEKVKLEWKSGSSEKPLELKNYICMWYVGRDCIPIVTVIPRHVMTTKCMKVGKQCIISDKFPCIFGCICLSCSFEMNEAEFHFSAHTIARKRVGLFGLLSAQESICFTVAFQASARNSPKAAGKHFGEWLTSCLWKSVNNIVLHSLRNIDNTGNNILFLPPNLEKAMLLVRFNFLIKYETRVLTC